MTKSKFISLEGIEGAGKSTNIHTINKILDKHSISYVNTREPGGSSIGPQLRNLLLNSKTSISIEVELLLMLADRKDHVENLITPSLNKGKWVISDRFMDSTIAYQGGGRGLQIEKIQSMANILGFPEPSITLLFDLPVEMALQRISVRGLLDRFESESLDFHKRIREEYLNLASRYPNRIKIIDSSVDEENVSKQIEQVIEELIQK